MGSTAQPALVNKASEYLKNAQACRQLANSMEGDQRAALLQMAETWEQLAADRAEYLVVGGDDPKGD